MILVISHKGFHPGFKLLGLGKFINLKDKNQWRQLPLKKRIQIAMQYKTIHYFWGRVDFFEMLFLLILRKKIILHFIGSDVLMIINSKSKQFKTKLYKYLGTKIFVVHENLKNELSDIGIKAEVIEFVNRKIENIDEIFPKDFSVLAYVPEGKEDFYNLQVIEETAKLFPKIKFYIFPYYSKLKMPNMISVKQVEHEKIIDLITQHKLFIRIPKHDGLPNTIIEALMCARYVVWSYEHPFVYKASTVNELSKIIDDIKNVKELNIRGKEYILENYDSSSLKDKFKNIWNLN